MITAGMLLLLMSSFLASTPVGAYYAPGVIGFGFSPSQPVWLNLSAVPRGNYPGGNVQFDVFIVNSAVPPYGNVTLFNETLTASALPACCNMNTTIGLPVTLFPGQAILTPIHLEIPSDFTQSNFTANLVADLSYWNGTAYIPLKMTADAGVYLVSLTPVSTQTTVTIAQSRGVSSSLFAVGAGIPSIVVVILLVLLARGRGRPSDTERR